jgi:hypothetical protein
MGKVLSSGGGGDQGGYAATGVLVGHVPGQAPSCGSVPAPNSSRMTSDCLSA